MTRRAIVSDELQALLGDGLQQELFSGAAAAVSFPDGRAEAFAGTLAWNDDTPVDDQSLFDLASVSKTFTAAVVVRLAEQGVLDLDAPVQDVLQVGGGVRGITLRRLLVHTSGLPAESFLWRDGDIPASELFQRVVETPLESAPGATHRYSCLGYIAAGAIVERVTASTLPVLVDGLVRAPLGLPSLSYGPVDAGRAAATEEQPWTGRGMVRGDVHDELAWYLGGRVGNAGLFGSVRDVLGFAESMLDDRLFGAATRCALTTDALEPRHGAPFGQALGARIGDRAIFGDAPAVGHPGFTGTMWLALPEKGIAGALLTNRVHPHRDRVELDPFRRRFSSLVASLGDERAGA